MARKPDQPKPATTAGDDIFMREVDDALRQDQMLIFWHRYGRWLLLALVLGLAAFAGWIFYQNSQAEASGVRAEEFVAAMDAAKRENLDGAAKALEPLTNADEKGYRAAALMGAAAVALQQGKAEEAAKGFAQIAADESLPKPYRDMALIRETVTKLDTLTPAQIIERLDPLAVPESAWFGSAGELVALAHLQDGDRVKAGSLFAEISGSENVPQTIRARAQQMAGILGVDAVDDAEETDAKAEGEAE